MAILALALLASGLILPTPSAPPAKAYGKLLSQLESKDLVTLAQTQDEAIEAAAQARTKKTGEPVENVRERLMAGVRNSIAPQRVLDADGLARLQRVAEIVSNGNVPSGQKIDLGRTPSVLQMLGALDVRLNLNPHKLTDALKPGKKHGLSVDAVVLAIENLGDPLAVMKSRTRADSLLVLTEATETDGRPMVVAVTLGKDGQVSAINKVASVYAKDGAEAFMALNRKENNFLYVNNEKRQSLPETRRLQLPLGGVAPTITSDPATGVGSTIRSEIFCNLKSVQT